MTRASKEKILNDELKVLDVLEQHAKESIGEIAKKCGFSHQKVWRIIKDLETKKTIWGYAAITDETAKNFQHFILLIKRNTVPFDENFKKELLVDRLDNYALNIKIENLYITNGIYDNIATFYAKDLVSAKKLINELFKRIGKYYNEYVLIETMIPIRKYGLQNPKIKELIEYI